MSSEYQTGRIVHGGHPLFEFLAPWIDDAIEPDIVPVFTLTARNLPRPERYWFYNVEPLHIRRWRGAWYQELLDGAERVLDYSELNAEHYPRSEFRPIKLGKVGCQPEQSACDVDVLFYGLINERRREVVEALGARVVGGVYGGELGAWLQRSRLVLCFGAYDSRNGHPLRAFPALEMGARLVVEETQEQWFNDAVRPHVAAMVSYEELVPTCRRLLAEMEAAA